MIDFQNKTLFKLKLADNSMYSEVLNTLLVPDEKILYTYKALRDGVVFTNKRIFAINVQGLTGTKKDITSMPYSKIQIFSIETAGVLDLDGELDLFFSGLGKVRFEFNNTSSMLEIGKIISSYVL